MTEKILKENEYKTKNIYFNQLADKVEAGEASFGQRMDYLQMKYRKKGKRRYRRMK